MSKKVLSGSFVLGLMLTPSFALANFPDVFPANPTLTAINYVQQKGIVSGYPDGRFRPENSINRAEFVKILVKTKYDDSEISGCASKSFQDVPTSEWYAPYVCVAKKNHVVDGYPDGTFRPTDDVKFVEAAKILHNTMLSDDTLPVSSGEWYEGYVKNLAAHKAIPEWITAFDGQVRRMDMAEMIYRLDANVTNQPSLEFQEIGDEQLIESYYAKIGSNQLEEAYAMKADPGTTLDQFKTTYQDFPQSWIKNFHKIAPSTYSFVVGTLPNLAAYTDGVDTKKPTEYYTVTMKVVDGKLQTISSSQSQNVVFEKISAGSLQASVEFIDGAYNVYVTDNGKKTLVKSFKSEDSINVFIDGLAFSPNGTRLSYQVHDWEVAGTGLYDIEHQKVIEEGFLGLGFYGFSPDDKFFYTCSESGMSGGEVSVVDFRTDTVVRVAENNSDFGIQSCDSYNPSTGVLSYSLFDNTDSSIVKKTYQMK